MFVVGLLFHDDPSTLPGLNITFAAKLLFVMSLWWGGHIARRQDCVQAGSILEAASHIVAAILFAAEFERWGGRSEEFSRNFALALLSAVWAFQAFGLIWAGLATRMKLRRLLGLALFGITVLKVVFFDMTELGRGTQIISFVASGLLLLVAATFYARFSAVFLEEGERGDDF
jgi:predicted membrane channel-forming protein YqfA (hemolysin III family)